MKTSTAAITLQTKKKNSFFFFKLLFAFSFLFLFACNKGADKNSAELMSTTLEKMNTRFAEKNAELYVNLERASLSDPRVMRVNQRALEVKKICNDLFTYLGDLKNNTAKINAAELKMKLAQYNEQMLSFLQENEKQNFIKNYPVSDPGSPDLVMLTKLQSDALLFESDLLSAFQKRTESNSSFKFDALEAVIIPNSTNIPAGKKYEAVIYLSAYSSVNTPEILFGEYDATNNSVNEIKNAGTVSVNGGKAKYTIVADAPGHKTYSGVIRTKKPDGSFNLFPFKGEYEVTK
jgi:hypothetical protein